MDRSRWAIAGAVVAPPLLVALVLWIPITADQGSTEEDMWVGATEYGPVSAASPEEVDVIHRALHEIGELCQAVVPDLSAVKRDVDLIISLAERFPTGRFPIDDETATASSLLIVTESALGQCDPEQAQRVDAVERGLPTQ